jgi:GTPase
MMPKVMIIGRPNVGKSSFFNMYTGHKIAIVADEAWTTRDVSEYEFIDENNKMTYILSDSGGLDFSATQNEMAKDIIERTTNAIEESDVLIWLLEFDKATEDDKRILQILKRKNVKNVIVVANKADNENKIMEAMSLTGYGGYENFFVTSVAHHKWFEDIQICVAKILKKMGFKFLKEIEDESAIKLAIVGRPNVGKSSIINAILWKNRVMVADFSGTTRDSIDTKVEHDDKKFILIDTAWIRRLSKVGTRNIENWSVMRSQRAIIRADVVTVVIDGVEGVTQQDLSIISSALAEKKWLVIVVNKWDLVLQKKWVDPKNIMDRYINYLREKIDFLPWVSVIFTAATEKKRVKEVLERAAEIVVERQKRVKTSIINDFIEQVMYKHAPTGNKKSHNPKIYYGSQVDINPPKFVFSVNNTNHFHFSYLRYLENRIRDTFWFFGTPMTIEFKGKEKRYAKEKNKTNERSRDRRNRK